MTHTSRTGNVDVDAVALGIVKVFPTLDLFKQRLSLELYRLLSEGQPVTRAVLAERLQASAEIVDRILDGWPGVFSDSERRIIGYWGLSMNGFHLTLVVCAAVEEVEWTKRSDSVYPIRLFYP
jgi:hypothetical protein